MIPHMVILYCVRDTLFSPLSHDIIIKVAGAIIIDGQVLVIGSSLHEVTSTVLELQLLARPFTFCGPVIPILPSVRSFLSLLDSPNSFLIGVALSPELRELTFLDSSIFVNLDRHEISCGSFPVHPNEEGVIHLIGNLITKEKSHIWHPFAYTALFMPDDTHKFCFFTTTMDLIASALGQPLVHLFSEFVTVALSWMSHCTGMA